MCRETLPLDAVCHRPSPRGHGSHGITALGDVPAQPEEEDDLSPKGGMAVAFKQALQLPLPDHKVYAAEQTRRLPVLDVLDVGAEAAVGALHARLPGAAEDLLQRCCRASRGDVSAAEARAEKILKWRAEARADTLLEDPASVAEELRFRPLLLCAAPGVDRKGRPVLLQAVGRWDIPALDRAVREEESALLRAHSTFCELLSRQAREAAAASGANADGRRVRVPQWITIFDMKGFSTRHMRYPQVLACVQEMGVKDAERYPESIDRIFVVNTPRVFYGLWVAISQLLKARTRAKVCVLPEGEYGELVKECGPEVLPVSLGGVLTADATAPF